MRSGSSWPITRSATTAVTPKLDSRVRTVLRTSWTVQPYFLRATARVNARSSIGFSESTGEGSSQADEPHSANNSLSTESAIALNGTRCGTRLSAVFFLPRRPAGMSHLFLRTSNSCRSARVTSPRLCPVTKSSFRPSHTRRDTFPSPKSNHSARISSSLSTRCRGGGFGATALRSMPAAGSRSR